eukprot:s200_g20.t8
MWGYELLNGVALAIIPVPSYFAMEQPGCVVAVVGAGLAGLSFAAALMQDTSRNHAFAKCKVVVFEQSLVLDPGALRSLPLARVGLKALRALECPLVGATFRQGIDCIRREDLLKWFVTLLPADTIHFGKSFRGFHVDGNQLFCRFQSRDAGNLQLEGPFDAVVAADGLRSDVRSECEAACKQGPHRLRDLILGGSILFLGDAQRAFRKERDLGLGRVFGGGNNAIEQGVQLAGSLTEAFDRAARPVHGSTSLHQALHSKSLHSCHFMAVAGLSERLRWYCRKRLRPCDGDEPSVENRSNLLSWPSTSSLHALHPCTAPCTCPSNAKVTKPICRGSLPSSDYQFAWRGDASKLLGAGASSLLRAMDFPPEVRELVRQLKSAGMQIDESNPQEVMQALFRVQQMAANKKKSEMVSKERALPGRSEAQVVPAQHYVLNNPMKSPWPAGFKVCVFANGCFWGSEKGIWRLPGGGIYSTAVGYAGGYTPNPTYEEACSGQTGHTEAVQVVFDPSKISLVDILRWFWEAHDPTQGMGQGNDRGTQYRSALYYFDDEQRQLYEASKEAYEAELKANGKGRGPITTEIRAASDFEGEVFFYAEEYHQQYLAKPGARPYCSAEPQQVSLPAFEKWCPAVLQSTHAPKLPEEFWSLSSWIFLAISSIHAWIPVMKGSLALAALLHEIQAAGPSGSGSGVAQVGNLTEPTTHNSSTEHKAGSEAKLCEVLKDEHGEWTGSVHPGGLYVLTCSRGYQVDGHSQVNMTCSRHAEWPAKPWCEAVDDCEKLLYKCGPAGLCHDLQDGVECMCERGAERSLASNGEAVCHFQGTTDCGGRNCGSHGVCVHLKEYQNTFDTGNSSFRCSCERGYMDDGEKCVAADCGPLQDPFGIWHGSHAYLGEYTLECHDDAFVWGGTEQAATISCPSFGRWRTVPRCLSPLEERREAERERISFVFHVCASVVCIVSAALAAGLTMGLVSLEPVELQIIEAARLDDCTTEKEKERLQKQKDAAKRILPLLKACNLQRNFATSHIAELMAGRIASLQVFALRGPKLPRPHWTAFFPVPPGNEVLAIDPLVKPWKNGLADLIVGEDALAPERLYHKLFRLTANKVASEKGWSREAMIRLSAAVDLACWDIVGKAAGLPLYRIFGGFKDEVDCYATCGYYREGKDEHELRDDLQMMVDQGHTGFKVKIGGLPLHKDMERLRVIREVIGYDKDLMVDVNRAWDFKTACEGVKLLEAFKPRWLEEPVAWEDDRRLLGLLSRRTSIPLSGGESEFTSYGCRALLEEKAISILQFDATMYGGFTEGRKLAALCELNHVQVAPHHDCFIHAQLVASTPAGLIVEAFTDPERDPLQAELYQDAPAIRNGKIKLGSAAGIGLTLNERAVEKYGERIDHHLLLVTLLLLNALANEALPIFLDDLLSPVFAVLLSVTFVLICGEILPSAVFTGPAQLTVSASFIPVVKILLTTMYCIAKPIARMLDEALVHNREERFSRPEVRSVLRLHSPSGHQAAREAYREREGSAEGSPGGQSCLSGSRSAAENQLLPSEDPPQPPSVLNDLEVDLCMAVLMLGDTLVADSPAFYTLKRCARRVMPADFYSPAISVAADAVSSNKDFVVVFPNIDNVEWPVEVTWEEIVGILRTSELLATQSCTPIGSLCKRKQRPARIEAHETAADALAHIADACESPCGIGVVHRNDDFFGIFDGEDALCGAIAEQEEFAVPCTPSDRLSRQRREAGLGIVQSRSDASPSSSTGSPARETIPESAHLTGRTLGEIASMALEPVDEKEVRDRFHTDPQPDVVRGISLPLPSRSTSSAMDVVKSMSYSVGSPAAPSELEENQRQTHPADIAPGQTPLERSRPRPAQLSSELELTVPLQVLSEGTEVPEVPPTVPDTAPVPEEERDLEEISLGSRPSQGPFSGGQESVLLCWFWCFSKCFKDTAGGTFACAYHELIQMASDAAGEWQVAKSRRGRPRHTAGCRPHELPQQVQQSGPADPNLVKRLATCVRQQAQSLKKVFRPHHQTRLLQAAKHQPPRSGYSALELAHRSPRHQRPGSSAWPGFWRRSSGSKSDTGPTHRCQMPSNAQRCRSCERRTFPSLKPDSDAATQRPLQNHQNQMGQTLVSTKAAWPWPDALADIVLVGNSFKAYQERDDFRMVASGPGAPSRDRSAMPSKSEADILLEDLPPALSADIVRYNVKKFSGGREDLLPDDIDDPELLLRAVVRRFHAECSSAKSQQYRAEAEADKLRRQVEILEEAQALAKEREAKFGNPERKLAKAAQSELFNERMTIRRLQKELRIVKEMLKESEDTFAQLFEDLVTTRRKDQDLEDAQNGLENTARMSVVALAEERKKVHEKTEIAKKLKARVQELEENEGDVHRKKAIAERRIVVLDRDIGQLQQDVKRIEVKYQESVETMLILEERCREEEAKLKEERAKVEVLTAQIAEEKKWNSILKQDLAKAQSEIEGVTDEKNSLFKENKSLDKKGIMEGKRAREAEAEAKKVRELLVDSSSNLVMTTHELGDEKLRVSDLEHELEKTRNSLKEYQDLAATRKGILEGVEKEVVELTNQLKDAEAREYSLTRELKKLKVSLSQSMGREKDADAEVVRVASSQRTELRPGIVPFRRSSQHSCCE